ncbi:hypothetical protein, partial [Rhodosalinus sp. FB01]|uniref:hypothetical protein n=1 Tax=Rhodosalinus sp. FB01 TaxID=3239194 RepID=UPI00352636C2
PEKVKGKVREAVDLVDWILHYEPGLWDVIPFNWLAKQVDMDKSNFRRTVRNNPDFREAMQERGLEEGELANDGCTMKGLTFIEHPFTEDPDGDYIAN